MKLVEGKIVVSHVVGRHHDLVIVVGKLERESRNIVYRKYPKIIVFFDRAVRISFVRDVVSFYTMNIVVDIFGNRMAPGCQRWCEWRALVIWTMAEGVRVILREWCVIAVHDLSVLPW